MNAYQAAQRYSNVRNEGNVLDASPHRLIQMLFEGALERIAQAKGAMLQKQIARKGELIGKAINIVGGLQGSLNDKEGGELAANLDALYDYIIRRLAIANKNNDPDALDECGRLLGELKMGWDAIADGGIEMLRAVKAPEYIGMAGVMQLREIQSALNDALRDEDWDRVRRLDQCCVVLIDKVIAANKHDGQAMIMALNELKGVYSSLIVQCQREVASMAH